MITVETLMTEDLDLGVGTTSKTHPGGGVLNGTQVGIHSFGRGRAAVSETWNPGLIAAGSQISTTIVYPGAVIGDFVLVSHDKLLNNALLISAHVSASGIVRVTIANLTGSPVTPASGTLKVLVMSSR